MARDRVAPLAGNCPRIRPGNISPIPASHANIRASLGAITVNDSHTANPIPSPAASTARRLNIGCGRTPMAGWTNVDAGLVARRGHRVRPGTLFRSPIPIPRFGRRVPSLARDRAHPRQPRPHAGALAPGATRRRHRRHPHPPRQLRRGLGGSHARAPYFAGSFGFFSQPHYWRADYGYRGDWQPEVVRLLVEGRHLGAWTPRSASRGCRPGATSCAR